MSGYNYKKRMSDNAVRVNKEGILPRSMIKGIHLKNAGINETLINVKNAIKDGYIVPCGWHTTGGYWDNAVDYFDLDDVRRQIEVHGGLTQYYSNSSKSSEEYRVEGSYPIWGGTRKNRKIKNHKTFTGTLKSNGWIYMDQGGRKNSKGNWIHYDIIK